MHTEAVFQHAAKCLVSVQCIDCLDHDRDAGKLAVAVGRGERRVAKLGGRALAELDRFAAQHQVREVEVPRVRGHIGALCQVADVAQVALVDDLPVVLAIDPVDLASLALVDQVKERRK